MAAARPPTCPPLLSRALQLPQQKEQKEQQQQKEHEGVGGGRCEEALLAAGSGHEGEMAAKLQVCLYNYIVYIMCMFLLYIRVFRNLIMIE
jgi:hypothetical protein